MRTTLHLLLLLLPATILAQKSDPHMTARMNAQMTAQRPAAVFEENKGQMKDQHWQPRPDVLFNGSANGMAYYVRDNGMSYQLSRVESWKDEEDDRFDMPGREKRQVPDEMGTYRVDVQWTDFNADYTVEKGAELPGYTNYYNVPEGVEPALFVKQYESVTLRGLYDGIDLRLYGTDGHLETDWLVAPGADYTQIGFEVKGAALSVDAEGHLIMGTPFGEIREGTLKVFQEGRQLEAYWRLSSLTDSSGTVSFEVMGHDPMLAMRIDPVVRVWGTYCPQLSVPVLATDSHGHVYMGGSASINTAVSGGHQSTYGGGSGDAFLLKLNGAGTIVWASYYGGSGGESAAAVCTDVENNVFLAGTTLSPNAIASNGHQESFGGTQDAFLVKFNSDGVRLWATYYGGNASDVGQSCTSDSDGNVYLSGWTFSTSGIASNGHQNTYAGGQCFNNNPCSNAFLVKFSSAGIRQWGTYYGGTGEDRGYSCATDPFGNVILGGSTTSTSSIASGGHQNTYGGTGWDGSGDAFLVKFNSEGMRQWATYFGGSNGEDGYACTTDSEGNSFLTGWTQSSSGISSGGHQNLLGGTLAPGQFYDYGDAFLVKFDPMGVRQWSTYYGGSEIENGRSLVADGLGNTYVAGDTYSSSAIASNGFQSSRQGAQDGFMACFNPNGLRLWGTYYGGEGLEIGYACAVDLDGNAYLGGSTQSQNGIAMGGYQNTLQPGSGSSFLVKFRIPRIGGRVWVDLNENCIQNAMETSTVNSIPLTIQPGNHVTQTENGHWTLDSLPSGSYTVSIDTTNSRWLSTCPEQQAFTVSDPNILTQAPSFGIISASPCASPDISVMMPQMRRGFGNQTIHVSACNGPLATDILVDAFCIVKLDTNISVQSASLPFTELGDSQFQFNIGDLYPGHCVEFTMNATVELTAVANQTLCLSAELYPQPACVFDTIPDPYPPTVEPCDGTWDGSSLTVEAHCDGDSVYFTVSNTGEDMACFAPVRVYVNGNQMFLDSLMLAGGDSAVFTYLGNGQTWRLEADQHPYHPGNSNPSAHMEICGSSGFQPFIVTMFPQDDADPVIDIFCDQVSAPYDPNDKTGSPRGLGETHAIQRGQQIEYLVRFQNIGTDTAVNVVILDTLSTDLNIFTVQSGVSSHPYEFRMYGPRVLEWKFNNILLPDSTTDGPGSNGFVMFKVQQVPNLPYGTVIENTANIYFDFEEPVITNTYFHTVTPLAGTAATVSHDGNTVICGEGSINLHAPLGNAYLWNTGDTVQTISVTEGGEYWVTVGYVDGSSGTTPAVNISTAPLPTVVFSTITDTLNTLSPPVNLVGTPSGGTFSGTGVTDSSFHPAEAGAGMHCITYTYTDGVGCSGDDEQCILVRLSSGLGEEATPIFTVFPNPGNGLFTLVTSEGGAVRLTVTDISGREVFQESYTATPGTARSIDISKQANGIYTLRIETEKGNGGVRLVKE